MSSANPTVTIPCGETRNRALWVACSYIIDLWSFIWIVAKISQAVQEIFWHFYRDERFGDLNPELIDIDIKGYRFAVFPFIKRFLIE